MRTFLTKDEHDSFLSQGKEEDDENLVEEESKDYHKSYLNAMMDLKKKYNLRRRNVVVDPPKKDLEGQSSTSHPVKNMPRKEVVQQKHMGKDLPKDNPSKEKGSSKRKYTQRKRLAEG